MPSPNLCNPKRSGKEVVMETNSPNGGRQAEQTRGTASPPQARNDETQSRQAVSGTQESGQDRSRTMSRRNAGDLSRSSSAHSPWQTMTRLSREMDQLFDSFFGNRFGVPRVARNWPYE